MKQIFTTFTLVIFFIINNSAQQTEVVTDSITDVTTETTNADSTEKLLQITGVGDIMLGTHFPNRSYLPRNVKSLFHDAIPYLKDTDILFGNLEGCFLDEGEPSKICSNPQRCYVFKMPTKFAAEFKHAGFDMLSVANNHVGDFGVAGKSVTGRLLDSLNIAYAGLISKKFCIVEKDGIKYGMIAFSPNKGTVAINNNQQAVSLVKKVKSLSDIVIVSFHGGAEGSKHQHITRETEMYIGENRGNVYKFSRQVIDAGADVVFGHGPHVTRTVDIYKNRFIIYSMGNFCTYGRFNLRGANGIAPIVKVFVNKKGEFQKGKIVSIKQPGRGGVKIDTQQRVVSKLQELLKIDIPESNLIISNNGDITVNNSNL